jgi:hypothetical protein
MNNWAGLAAAMSGAPELPGARCMGKAEWFDPAEPYEDPEDVRYRHDYATRICESCPALSPCGEWLRSLKPSNRPVGVVAGKLVGQQKKGVAA